MGVAFVSIVLVLLFAAADLALRILERRDGRDC